MENNITISRVPSLVKFNQFLSGGPIALSLVRATGGHRIFGTNFSFSHGIVHYGKSLIAIFRKFFVSINKVFIFAGD